MGWNIFYKECKYIAAHQTLKFLRTQYQKYALRNPGDPETNFKDIKPAYQMVRLGTVKKALICFPLHMIHDAVWMIYNSIPDDYSKEIELFNSGKISEIQVRLTVEGETALKDRKYIRLFWGSAKIIIPLAGSVIYTLVDLAKKLFG